MDEFETLIESAFEESAPEETEAEEETVAEETEENDSAEPIEGEASQEETPATIDYKFNHETKALDKASVENIANALGISVEDVVNNLQKGNDYDRVRSKSDEMSVTLGKLAKTYNTTLDKVPELLDRINDQAAYRKAYNEARDLDPNASEETLQRIANQQVELNRENEKRLAAQEQDDAAKPWIDFFANHTELNAESVPNEVYQMVDGGMNPEIAYLVYQKDSENLKLKQELNDMKTRAKSPGSVTGSGTAEKKSLYEEGWDEVFG